MVPTGGLCSTGAFVPPAGEFVERGSAARRQTTDARSRIRLFFVIQILRTPVIISLEDVLRNSLFVDATEKPILSDARGGAAGQAEWRNFAFVLTAKPGEDDVLFDVW